MDERPNGEATPTPANSSPPAAGEDPFPQALRDAGGDGEHLKHDGLSTSVRRAR
jgi:hypothetical protein